MTSSPEQVARPRKRKRKRREPPPDSTRDDLHFQLGAAGRAKPVLWLVAAAGIVAGLVIHVGQQEPFAILLVSAGLVAAAIAITPSARPAGLSVDGTSGALTIVDDAGVAAVVPRSAVASVNLITRTSTRSDGDGSPTRSMSYALQLNKRDGGFLEMGAWSSREEPRRIAEAIGEVMAATGDAEPEAAGDPLARLSGSRLVRARRFQPQAAGYRERAGDDAEGALEVTWPALPRLRQVLLGPLFTGAIVLPIWALSGPDRGAGTYLLMAVFGGIGLVAAISGLRDIGVTQAVVVDAAAVAIERRRGARVLRRRSVPLHEVVSVDFGGGMLTVRPQDAHVAQAKVMARSAGLSQDPGIVEVGSMVGAVIRAQQMAVTASVVGLGLADSINLDMALSEEIERRVGALAGTM